MPKVLARITVLRGSPGYLVKADTFPASFSESSPMYNVAGPEGVKAVVGTLIELSEAKGARDEDAIERARQVLKSHQSGS